MKPFIGLVLQHYPKMKAREQILCSEEWLCVYYANSSGSYRASFIAFFTKLVRSGIYQIEKNMKIFSTMYDKTMEWSKHRFAVLALFCQFYRGDIFPIPPDVMLIPMSMSKPKSAVKFAFYTAIASVIGGVIGYAIGFMQRTGWKTLYNNGDMLCIGQKPSVGLSNGAY